ncbi:MAG: LysR family transcriptional regulator [Sphingomonadales bacterium]|nr:LysR family transcriptional regulator [Sphingomonadales bacterium]
MLEAITLDQMRTLVAAADEGSFSAAARRLGRAQSVVSQTISGLELRLKVPLFERGSTRRARCCGRPISSRRGRAIWRAGSSPNCRSRST